jgi:hypothetical protein
MVALVGLRDWSFVSFFHLDIPVGDSIVSSTVRANLSRRLFVGKAMMCDLFSGPFSQSMLGPLRRRHAAPCSTLTSQLVPSVMICAWNFFNVTKRGEESRKAATFVQVNIQSIREGPKQTSSAGSATNYQGQVGRTHTHTPSIRGRPCHTTYVLSWCVLAPAGMG